MKYPDINIQIKYPNKLINADTPKVGELSQQYPLQSGSTPFKHEIEVLKNWLKSWGTIPAVPPRIWQYPLST